MKKLSIITSLLLACSTAFAAAPSFSGMELKKIDGTTTFTEMDAGEAIQITLQNVSDGGKTDTKRRFYSQKNNVKGQGIFSILSKNQVLWQAPKVQGTYSLAAYLENVDGTSSIITQDIVVRDPFISNPGKNNCPINFVFVPNSQGLHGEAKGWCVMKYEASPYSTIDISGTIGNSGNTVSFSTARLGTEYSTSKSSNPIYYSGPLSEAKSRCSNVKDSNGTLLNNTSIISIDVWSSLVRDLYAQSFNWTGGGVGSGILKIGHTDNIPSYPLISTSDDLDIYYATGNTIDLTDFSKTAQARTMKTSYGDIIWDIVGNTREYFRENYSNNNFVTKVYQFSESDTLSKFNKNYITDSYLVDYTYTNPLTNNTYLKLLPKNILGFRPSIIPKYLNTFGNSGTTLAPQSYSSFGVTLSTGMYESSTYYNGVYNNNLIEKVETELLKKTTTNSVLGSRNVSLFGYGASSYPNTTGTISYNTSTGNPIMYGGMFNSLSAPISSLNLLSSNVTAGLFQTSSLATLGVSGQVASDTTTSTSGFRCMIPAN